MAGEGNILIADESALHALLHSDWGRRIDSSRASTSPLQAGASTLADLQAFNVHHPLYGPPPVTLLVDRRANRRFSDNVQCRTIAGDVPAGSFFRLREGLYMATPEFVFIRMANFKTLSQLAEIGMNLCARYYIDAKTGAVEDRGSFLTTPEKLLSFAQSSCLRGSKKAMEALRFVLPNSGSPYETKMKLLLCHPLVRGGLTLPFTEMNYDVKAGRLQRIMAQSTFCIDLADPRRCIGVEYDGQEGHLDASHDKRRRNELAALGWTIFPIDKNVFLDPDATIRAAEQIAKRMNVRIRRSENWYAKYLRLRKELGLKT